MKKLLIFLLTLSMVMSSVSMVSFASTSESVDVSYGTRIEMENYFYKKNSDTSNSALSGGFAGVSQRDSYVTDAVCFKVSDSGYYDIVMKICAYVGDRSEYGTQQLNYTSPVKIQIDSEEAFLLSKYQGTIVHESIEALDSVWYSTIRLSVPVKFEAGSTHTITFTNDGTALNGNVYFGMDYIEFAAPGTDVYFDGEKYLPKTTAGDGFTNSQAGWLDGIKYDVAYKMSFYTDEPVQYKIKMLAAGDFTTNWYSPTMLSIDDGNAFKITASSCNVTPHSVKNWAEVETKDIYTFEPGLHTITLSTNGAGSSQTGGQRALGLDWLKLAAPSPVLKVEGESVMDKSEDNEYCSGGKYGSYNKSAIDGVIQPVSVPCNFYVAESGYYDVQIVAGGKIKSGDATGFLSHITMRIDDAEGFVLDAVADGKNVTELAWEGSTDQFGKFSVDELQYFDAGVHTIYVEALSAALFQPDKNVVMWLDYVELKPYTIPETAVLNVENDGIVEINGVLSATVVDENGQVIDENSLITFTSSDENVFEVDANGNIYAKDYGFAYINACVNFVSRIDGTLVNVETEPVKVRVMSEQGIYVDSFSRNGANVSVSFKTDEEIANGATVIIAAYNAEGKSFKTCEMKAVTDALNVGDEIEFTTSLTDVTSADGVCVFIWDNLNDMMPLYGKIIIE